MTRYERRQAAFRELGVAPDRTPWHELRKRLGERKVVRRAAPATVAVAAASAKAKPKAARRAVASKPRPAGIAPSPSGRGTGRDALKAAIAAYRVAFPVHANGRAA
jgi:hypothetical protein